MTEDEREELRKSFMTNRNRMSVCMFAKTARTT